jgi:Flp pilus assembly pilin Flp
MYRAQGFAHATAVHHLHRLRSREEGQGTVEYVGLILLLAGVMVAVVKQGKDGSIATSIVGKLKESIADVGGGK